MPGFLEDHGGWRHQVPASSSFESTIWLWHSQFAMENHHCLQVNHGKPSISIRAIDKPWLCWSLPDDTKNLEIFAGTTRGVHSQKALMAEKFHPVDSVDYPYMLHGARIFTYKTGWFLGQMLGFIFQHHGAYGIAEDWLYPSPRDQDFRAGFFCSRGCCRPCLPAGGVVEGGKKQQTRAVTRCESL